MEFKHKSVLLKESIDGLNVKSGGVYFDATLGGGGHSKEILKRSAPSGILIATDLDSDAISAASERLKEFKERFLPVHSDYKRIKQILSDCKVEKLDGIIADLGVSSYQLDNAERGFSYMALNAALDMRMDSMQTLSACDIVNEYPEQELKKILINYGEERFAGNIARNIVKERKIKKIATVKDLIDILERSIPVKSRGEGHIAKRTFQALRIEVNGELKGLKEFIVDGVRALKKGGRMAVITFHSLEDRIVKEAFKELSSDCICPKSLPVCVCGKKREIIEINRKPITASEEELKNNSRAKSAKLRIAEKVTE